MASLFSLGALLDSIDSATKESLEGPKVSATAIRSRRKGDPRSESSSDIAAIDAAAIHAREEVASKLLEEHSSHSGRTLESYVVPSPPRSHSGSLQGSDDSKEAAALPASTSSAKLHSSKDMDELKKLLRKKSQEIEKLNREVLDLEEQHTSLKDEVQEAWNHYKQAQEKAAFREAELLDEVKQVQKAKAADKAQGVAAITRLQDDVSTLAKQLQALGDEKAEHLQQISGFDAVQAQWQERMAALEAELTEARAHTIQGSQNLRDELKAVQSTAEQMRIDNALLMKQNQVRQSALEAENAALNRAIAEAEREMQRLRHADGSHQEVSISDHVQLEREWKAAAADLKKEQERCAELELRVRELDKGKSALQIRYDEERRHNSDSYNMLVMKVQELEKLLKIAEARPAAAAAEQAQESKEVHELKQQVQHLSQLLLKRQSSILELQSERSALKARVAELETRCKQTEQSLRDMDDDGDADYYAVSAEEGRNPLGGAGVLQRKSNPNPAQRRTAGGDGAGVQQTQLISDLEKMGMRPNAGVGRAMTLIDTYALITGRFLRSYPLVRLGFVFYLLLLHLWALFILVLHTHGLDLPDSPQEQIGNSS